MLVPIQRQVRWTVDCLPSLLPLGSSLLDKRPVSTKPNLCLDSSSIMVFQARGTEILA
jgi:hypothetical protein